MNVLLSIKPEYAARIVEGEKKYEFRKRVFRRKDIELVYIYSTSPICKIIGTVTAERILEGSVEEIWEICSSYSGITEEEYFCYFEDKKKAFAIEIKEVRVFTEPIDPDIVFENFRPPQSFCYFSENPFPFQEEEGIKISF
jgi:type I restriction enzyme S subunit